VQLLTQKNSRTQVRCGRLWF